MFDIQFHERMRWMSRYRPSYPLDVPTVPVVEFLLMADAFVRRAAGDVEHFELFVLVGTPRSRRPVGDAVIPLAHVAKDQQKGRAGVAAHQVLQELDLRKVAAVVQLRVRVGVPAAGQRRQPRSDRLSRAIGTLIVEPLAALEVGGVEAAALEVMVDRGRAHFRKPQIDVGLREMSMQWQGNRIVSGFQAIAVR